MTASVQTQTPISPVPPQAHHWGFAPRLAFRFCFVYFGLFCLFTQILSGLLPTFRLEIPNLGILAPCRQIVLWTAAHIFSYQQPVVFSGSGSGDKVFDWVLWFCLLAVALAAACVWSLFDQHRPNYDTLEKWFRVFLRFALAGQLFLYGLIKIVPMQMRFPTLQRLIEPYGNFSPMGVLWWSIGASPGYEAFVGSAELLAGLLLVIPATGMLGALICLIDMIEVFVLNMTYDVPVKLYSFHLMLMAAFLLIPERSRLLRFCFPNCLVAPTLVRQLFTSPRGNRIATAAQLLFGAALLANTVDGISTSWFKYGGGAPRSVFYGIWNVDEMRIDGVVRAPLLTDYDRWRRVVFENPQSAAFQRMDDSFANFGVTFDPKHNTLTMTQNADKKWKGQLAVNCQSAGRMSMDGQMGEHKVGMQLSLMDRNKFVLVNRGFHWIQDYPFNR